MVGIANAPRLDVQALSSERDVPPVLSVAAPLFVVAAPVVVFFASSDYGLYRRWFIGERAPIETATIVVALWGLWHAVRALRRRSLFPNRCLAWWMGTFAVGFVYVAGEEASWGQHWLGFATPSWLEPLNRQGEFNLHNTSKTLDRLSKSLLGLAVVFGGLLAPLYRRWRGLRFRGPDDWRWWLWPSPALAPLAAIVLVVWASDRTALLLDLPPERGGELGDQELRELLLVYFLTLYSLSIDRRLSRLRRAGTPAAEQAA